MADQAADPSDPPPSLIEQARAEAAVLETLVRAQAQIFAAGSKPDAVMAALCEAALETIQAADGVVVETRQGDDLYYRHAAGTALAAIGLLFPIEGSLSGRCLTEGRLLLSPNAPDDPRTNQSLVKRLGVGSAMVVPLFRRSEPLGVLKLTSSARDAFGSRDVLLAQLLAGLIATGFAESSEGFLLALTDMLRDDDSRRALEAASAMMGGYFECSRAGFAELRAEEPVFDFGVGWCDGSVAPLVGRISVDRFSPRIVARLAAGETVAIADIFEEIDEGERNLARELETRAILVVPLARGGGSQRIAYLNVRTPRRWSNQDIALMEQIAERVLQLVERRAAEQQVRESEAYWRNLFQQLDECFFIGEAVRDRSGAVIDWRYIEVNRAYLSYFQRQAEDIVGHTISEINPKFNRASLADVGRMIETGVPLSFDYQAGSRWFRGRCFRLEGERFGVLFIDATEEHRESHRQATLLALGDLLRGPGDPDDMAFAACALLGEALAVDRVGYGEIDKQAETIRIERDWNAPGVHSLRGLLHFRDYGHYIENLKRGETVAIADARLDVRTAATAAALEAISARSLVNMPVTEEGSTVALLYLNHRDVRDWEADLPLIREFAERTRVAVERRRAEQELEALTASLEEQVEHRTAALIAAEEQLRQSQKMEAVGQLTGGLAHDFNNMLTGISGALEMIGVRIAQGRTGELDRYVTAAQGAAKRAAALTHRLLAFSRRQTLDPKPTNANRLIGDMEELIRRSVGPGIEIEVIGQPDVWTTLVDPNQLENALLNLCINARDAMPDGGKITIETANEWLDRRAATECNLEEGPFVSLRVTDTGIGMSPEVQARAFDPFFTTKPLGEGTGLGLSMIYGFARQSNGQVRIRSEPGHGTTVCLYLPRSLDKADEGEAPGSRPAARPAAAGRTVLVVDDEPTVRMLIAEVLQDLGYAAIEAGDGQIALKLLESEAAIDLLVTDVGLPGALNGRQVADAARAARPGLKVLFITGYAESAVIEGGRLEAGMELVTKPFTMEGLGERIKAMLEE